MKKITAFLTLCLILGTYSSQAQSTLGSWVIPTNSSSLISIGSTNNLTGVALGSLATTATGGGVNTAGFGGTGFTTSTSVSATSSKNFNFSLSANAGYDLLLNGVSNFLAYSSASGPNIWTLFYSSNSAFTSNVTQIAQVTGVFSNVQTQNMTTAINSFLSTNPISVKSGNSVYFRLVGNQAVSTSGSGRIPTNTTVSLLGTVTVAPVANMIWNGGPSGLWNYDTTNLAWLDGSTSISFVSGSIANINSASSLAIDAAGVNAGALTNNIASGTTTLTGGNLTSGAIMNSGAGNLSIQVTNSATTLANTGTGTLTLSAPGTYTTVNVTGGTIQATVNTALSGAVNVSSGGTLDVSATSSNSIGVLTVSNGAITGSGILSASGSSFTLDSSDQTVPVSIRGSGNLTKAGSKSLTLSGSNTFSGDVNLNAGTLATSGNDRLPDAATLIMASNTIFRLGGNETIKALSASTTSVSSAQVDLQGYQLTLNVSASNAYVASIIGTGSLIKNGSSILTINENNTYSGGTTLNAGSFRLQASGNRTTNGDGSVSLASSPFGTGTLTIAGGKIFSSSTGGRTIYNSINVAGSFTSGDTSLTQNGDFTISTNVSGVFTTLSADASVTVDAPLDWYQPISGDGKALTKLGLANLHLRGSGTLGTLEAGTGNLYVRNTNNISTVIVRGGAILGYGSSNVFSPGYFGSAVLRLSNGATLGQFSACGAGSDAERTLPNDIQIWGDVVFGLGTYGNTFGGNIDLTGGSRTIAITNSTYLTGVVGNGALVVSNASASRTLYLNGNNTYTFGTTMNGGVVSLGHDNALGTGALTVNPTLVYTNVNLTTNTNVSTNVSGGVTNLVTNTVVNTNTNVTIASNTLTISSDRISRNEIYLGDGSSLNFDSTNRLWRLEGGISGFGSILKLGTGTLTLAGPLSYYGSTTVREGVLTVITDNISASIASNSLVITFSNTPVNGTYPILPGELSGAYTASYNNLSSSQKAAFSAASPASVTVSSKASQSITGLNATDTRTAADPAYTLSVAKGASSSPLTFSSDNTSVATVSTAGLVTIVGAGTTTLRVNQAGDANYLAAPEVTQVLSVTSTGSTFENAYPGVNLEDVAPNGLTYLMNYAFGGNSTNAASLPVQDTTDPDKLTLVAYVRTNDPTVNVNAEKGTSLSNWNGSDITTNTISDPYAPAGTEKRLYSVPVSTNNTQFLRLKVTK